MMIQTQNPETKSHINGRLARIEGQLRGVRKMIEEDRDCKDIVQQLIAPSAQPSTPPACSSCRMSPATACSLWKREKILSLNEPG